MRFLFTIPHYFRPTGGNAAHGSGRSDPTPRIAALRDCLASLRMLYGAHTSILDHRQPPKIVPANKPGKIVVDIVICTTSGHHILSQLPPSTGPYVHRETSAEPLLLGYECHAVLKEGLGSYDYYCYLEDDLIATDPWMFIKLAWFNRMAGDDALLQPNRFECGHRNGVNTRKLYVDGPLNPRHTDQFQNRAEQPTLTGQIMGTQVLFERPMNPHSGCFFLNANQMARWAARPDFLDRSSAFYAPLESAATLGIIRTFRVYKPAAPYSDFLELQHAGTGYLGLLSSAVPGDETAKQGTIAQVEQKSE